ncbi:hypothetical protein PENFLA_c006G02703 [Penicillium flavigenum]|uniref:Uncharacterized protein n=1 Tax=Penicillium flavigenum TaxID=254877 RepID=A0A1V6TKV6_9EURO|nr:hypothetical protein PENFLA_c006G02703 [Penicillium flavigenum]
MFKGNGLGTPEQLAVNGIDSGVFINELANIEILPRSLKSLSDGEKKSFGQNPENLHWKAHEQGPSPMREGTYRGTKLALTKAYDLIEQRFMSFMDVANFEPLVPSPLSREEKQKFFAFTNGSDGTPDARTKLEDVESYNRKARGSTHRQYIFDLPNVGDLEDWYSDNRFCQQQFTGANPTTIELASDSWIHHFIQAANAPEDSEAKQNITDLKDNCREPLYMQDYSYFREAVGLDPTAVIKSAFDKPDDKVKGSQLYPLAIVVDWRGTADRSVTIYNRELMKRKDLRSGSENNWQKGKIIEEAHDWPWRYGELPYRLRPLLRALTYPFQSSENLRAMQRLAST